MKVKEEPWRSQGRLPANPALQSSNPSLLTVPARNKEKVLKGKDGSSPVEHGDAQNPGTGNKVCWGDEGKLSILITVLLVNVWLQMLFYQI